jgi:hypothetical protein
MKEFSHFGCLFMVLMEARFAATEYFSHWLCSYVPADFCRTRARGTTTATLKRDPTPRSIADTGFYGSLSKMPFWSCLAPTTCSPDKNVPMQKNFMRES